jgi:uncharacterized protein YcgI (DUF1989 family)
MMRNQLRIVVARDINSAWDDLRIYAALLDFAQSYERDDRLFQSLAVIFAEGEVGSEQAFESALWSRVQSLADKDVWHGQSYDDRVSSDPRSPHFSLSFGGEAFFVVGLHPNASRPARRFERPTLVFNLHDQFERLRKSGLYEPLRAKIIERDLAIAGSINPMLARHGETSEACQYSGRIVSGEWTAPFNPPQEANVRHEIPPRSGVAFRLNRGQKLRVIDPEGEQVSDLVAFNAEDKGEVISSGRSLDYAGKLFLTAGDPIYSNRSNVMLRIVEDTVGRHDFLLTPCSKDTFRIIYGDTDPHPGCFGNLTQALELHGIGADQIPTAFNIFMNVIVAPDGALTVAPPLSRAGDHVLLEAEQDLIVALTACAAPQSNNYAFKPIHYEIVG